MPSDEQIQAVRQYLSYGYNENKQYKILDQPGDLRHIFIFVKDSEKAAQVEVMRSFWDDNPTPEDIAGSLVRLGLVGNLFGSRGKRVTVWTDHIAVDEQESA